MVTFDSEAQPQPPLQSPEPEPPVSIPDRFDVVSDINAKHPELLQQNTHDTIREFYHRVAWALHLSDPRWGMLGKQGGGQHQVIEGAGKVAEDAIAYAGLRPIVDIIVNANGNGPASAAWQVSELRRDSDEWIKPPRFVEPDNPTPTPEQPKPQPAKDWSAEFAALSKRVEAAEQSAVAAQSAALIAISKAEAIERNVERKLAEGLTATGKVDLPVVNEGWTRLRAKGDVVLKVKG
jgi:hypothetical protein